MAIGPAYGVLGGLGSAGDTDYLLADGTVALTGALDMGSNDIDNVKGLGVGTTGPGTSGIDLISTRVSQIRFGSSATDATNKTARMGAPHYTNAEQDVSILAAFSSSSSSYLYLGGGQASANAVTLVRSYAAADTITLTGTEMSRLSTDGLRIEAGVSADASYLLHVSTTAVDLGLVVDDATGEVAVNGAPVSGYGLTCQGLSEGHFYAPNVANTDWAYGFTYTGATATPSGFRVNGSEAEMMIFDSAGVETVHVDASGDSWLTGGDLGIGTSNPTRALDIVSTDDAMIQIASVETDATTKAARIGSRHYTNAEQPVAIVTTSCALNTNKIIIGGGSSSLNTATSVSAYCAADNTTLLGTEITRVTSAGLRIENSVSADAAYLLQVSATGDDLALCVDDTNGHVGIGQAPNATRQLEVTGTTRAKLWGAGMQIPLQIENGTTAAADLGARLQWIGQGGNGLGDIGIAWNGAATTDSYLVFRTRGSDSITEKMRITSAGRLALNGTATANAQAHLVQDSTTGAVPVLELDQDDVDQPFVEFDGTESANATDSVSTHTTSGAVQKHIQISINGSKYWLAALADPSA